MSTHLFVLVDANRRSVTVVERLLQLALLHRGVSVRSKANKVGAEEKFHGDEAERDRITVSLSSATQVR